jgi:hypothetical protein
VRLRQRHPARRARGSRRGHAVICDRARRAVLAGPEQVSAAPVIFAVRLGPGFQPGTLRISPGQHFVVTVDSSVKASGPDVPGSCPGTTARIDGGMLTMRCTSGVFYYTAQRPGTAELMATVRPRCARGSMCPQWITEATLKITIL